MLRLIYRHGPPGIIRMLPPPPNVIPVDSSGSNTPAENDLSDDFNDDFNDNLEQGEVSESSQYGYYQELQHEGADEGERSEGSDEGEEGEWYREEDEPIGNSGNNAEGENTSISDDGNVAPLDDDRSEFDMWTEIQRHVQRTWNTLDNLDNQDDQETEDGVYRLS